MSFDLNQLNFASEDSLALVLPKEKLTYGQLKTAVQKRMGDFPQKQELISVLAEEDKGLIIYLLAIIQSGNYPIFGQLDCQKQEWNFPKEPLFIGQTSGSTGKAKHYLRDWASWEAGYQAMQTVFPINEADLIATASPLATSLGLHTLFLALFLGKPFVHLNKKTPNWSGKTALFAVPTYLLKHSDCPLDLDQIYLGGGSLSASGLKRIIEYYPEAELFEFYGASESSFISWQNLKTSKPAGSVGQLFPQVQINVTADHSLTVRSPYLFPGYLGQTEAPVEWQLDDLAEYKEGLLILLGRKADLIDHGGNQVSPAEIEKPLQALGQEAIAFGMPDELYGQKIALFCIQPLDLKRIQAVLLKLPAYKRPETIYTAKEVPLTANQKVSRHYLAQLAQKGKLHEI
ncbi:AMP-binding protein [Eupransor demetentiae]|uniref:O-succinylbenzoic acid-CoA ligase MenE or related acyl-CoA synthetase (AMP-forming) (MenE/FadK) n=1 Tax=Eupransor demetentiae TaxID=3109584 RepID=A0ABM9N403_9LACO|nr:O-succinylbenzoic acid-CoA ligase MenE or related acyl-CoA synthetase (AMP-forming) (MenE/FadK) [Lactobacillaceae bacterium LMG 33000]